MKLYLINYKQSKVSLHPVVMVMKIPAPVSASGVMFALILAEDSQVSEGEGGSLLSITPHIDHRTAGQSHRSSVNGLFCLVGLRLSVDVL